MERVSKEFGRVGDRLLSAIEVSIEFYEPEIKNNSIEEILFALSDGDASKVNQILDLDEKLARKFYYNKLVNKINEMRYTLEVIKKQKK